MPASSSPAPHHVTQRGNNRQDVFFTDDDRRLYLELLRERALEHGVTLQAWCLMTNHVHLVLTPPTENALAGCVGRTHWRFTQTINRLHGRSGHLWQNRFHSCVLIGEHELTAIRYVERNPVRAGIVRVPWRYPWSSAAAHAGTGPDPSEFLDLKPFARRFPPEDWKRILREPLDENAGERLERCLRTGRPLASDRWLAQLETRINRRLRPLPRGRPRTTERAAKRG